MKPIVHKLLKSSILEDILLAMEYMKDEDERSITRIMKLALDKGNHDGVKYRCWKVSVNSNTSKGVYCITKQGVLFYNYSIIYYTTPIPANKCEEWGYKPL